MAGIMQNEVVSVDRMRRSDAYTIERFTSGRELMHRAAYGVYESYDGWGTGRIAIAVGGGNNGGDGYALAGILKEDGIESVIIKVSDKMSEDGRYYHDIAREMGVVICDYSSDISWDGYDVIVDCILGTGFSGEVRGRAGEVIQAINSSNAYVISVDINSGMNGDTGEAVLAVRSDLTVSIGYIKQGLIAGDSGQYIGRLVNVDIGIVLLNSETMKNAINRCAAAGGEALRQYKTSNNPDSAEALRTSDSPADADTGTGSNDLSLPDAGNVVPTSAEALDPYRTGTEASNQSGAGAVYREKLLGLLAIMKHISPDDIRDAGYQGNILSTLMMDHHLLSEVITSEADQLSLLSTVVTYIACSEEGLPDHSNEYMDRVTLLRRILEREYNTEAMKFCGSDGC